MAFFENLSVILRFLPFILQTKFRISRKTWGLILQFNLTAGNFLLLEEGSFEKIVVKEALLNLASTVAFTLIEVALGP